MKIILYSVPEDDEGKLLKRFLEQNNIPFKEVVTDDINLLSKVSHYNLQRKVSLLEIRNGYVKVITGFLEWDLKQLLKHINKYKPKLKVD